MKIFRNKINNTIYVSIYDCMNYTLVQFRIKDTLYRHTHNNNNNTYHREKLVFFLIARSDADHNRR